jgi:hypothetical protein
MDTLEIRYEFEKTTKRFHVYRPLSDLTCNNYYLAIEVASKPPRFIVATIREEAVL